MGDYGVIDKIDVMNVIDSTWSFKLKVFPDGLIQKFKAHFGACWDQQLEGSDFFKIYTPVLQMYYRLFNANFRSLIVIELKKTVLWHIYTCRGGRLVKIFLSKFPEVFERKEEC